MGSTATGTTVIIWGIVSCKYAFTAGQPVATRARKWSRVATTSKGYKTPEDFRQNESEAEHKGIRGIMYKLHPFLGRVFPYPIFVFIFTLRKHLAARQLQSSIPQLYTLNSWLLRPGGKKRQMDEYVNGTGDTSREEWWRRQFLLSSFNFFTAGFRFTIKKANKGDGMYV